MRIFGFQLNRKKKIAPSSRSSVHPASSGQDVYCLKRAKIKELLGVVTPEECQEVDELLDRSWQVDPCIFAHDDNDDDDHYGYDNNDDNESVHDDIDLKLCTLRVELPKQKLAHPTHTLLSTKLSEDRTTQKPYSIDMAMNAQSAKISASNQFSEDFITRKPGASVDVNAKVGAVPGSARKGRPAKLTGINDKAEALSSRNLLGTRSERTTAPYPNRIRERKNASCVISFPLPPPSSEKHYLPTPQVRASEGVFSAAHPLPQPPPPMRTSSQEQQIMPTTMPHPPGTPLHQTPQGTPPVTPRKQPPQTLQNTTPITPSLQPNPQMAVNNTGNVHYSPLLIRPLPGLTTLPYSHSPPCFASQHMQFTHSAPCSPLPRPVCPRNWIKGAQLGQGTFGTVYEGWNLEVGSFFAVKVSSREGISPEIQQEVDVLSKLEHPNIVRYLGSTIEDNRLCIFLELVRMGSLDSILRKYKRFEDYTIRSYTRQILLGLEYLHAKKTIHRDIKCANILVDVNGQVKLSDFGIAKQVGESMASSMKGTLLYMAPEVLMANTENSSSYSFPADIWSLGLTVLEMVDGRPPWHDLKGIAFFFKIKNGELPAIPEHVSPEGRSFICSCLKHNPEDRPTASKLLEHPFVSNVATPEPFFPSSPPSPLSPKLWQPASSSTWACGHCYPPSPSQANCFDRDLGGSQRAQTLIHGR